MTRKELKETLAFFGWEPSDPQQWLPYELTEVITRDDDGKEYFFGLSEVALEEIRKALVKKGLLRADS